MPALIEHARPNVRPCKQPWPIASAEVVQVARRAFTRWKDQLALEAGARPLLIQRRANSRAHLNVTLRSLRLRQPYAVARTEIAAHADKAVLEVDMIPAKRQRFVRPQPGEKQTGEKR